MEMVRTGLPAEALVRRNVSVDCATNALRNRQHGSDALQKDALTFSLALCSPHQPCRPAARLPVSSRTNPLGTLL